jgi:hypothetical protein
MAVGKGALGASPFELTYNVDSVGTAKPTVTKTADRISVSLAETRTYAVASLRAVTKPVGVGAPHALDHTVVS